MAPFDVVVSGFSIHDQPDNRKKELYQDVYNLLGEKGSYVHVEHVQSPTKWIE